MSEVRKETNILEEKTVSRRKLIGAGVLALGSVAAGGLLNVAPAISGPSVKLKINGVEIACPVPPAEVKGVAVAPIRSVAEALGAKVGYEGSSNTVTVTMDKPAATVGGEKVPAWPWPYKKLDAEKVRKRGYENYFAGGCMYGAASALLTTLVEEVGFPYNTIPQDMFKYGAGGSQSWGTLCGALNGSSAVINMVTKDFGKVVSELNGWYTEFPFPSDKHETYCKIKKQKTTVSKSPLCHVSVSTWANAYVPNERINDAGKKDRCAKLTGDVAAKAVEMLNAMYDQQFVASFKPSTAYSHCMTCHTGAQSLLDNQQGQMNCITCHDDHTK